MPDEVEKFMDFFKEHVLDDPLWRKAAREKEVSAEVADRAAKRYVDAFDISRMKAYVLANARVRLG